MKKEGLCKTVENIVAMDGLGGEFKAAAKDLDLRIFNWNEL